MENISIIQETLAKFSDINEQMYYLRSLCSLESIDLKQRDEICNFIETFLKELYPKCKVHMFGSSVNGLGFKNSDIDAYVDFKDNNMNLDADTRMKLLSKLKSKQGIHGVKNILNAKVPIIQFVHSQSLIKCDLSFSNKKALINSKYIRMCLQVDSRIPVIATVIKYWAICHGLSGSGPRKTIMSNYALTLLIIFYLQTESILPNVIELQEKMDKSESVKIKIKEREFEYGFPKDISVWTGIEYWSTGISKNLVELLNGFFKFYANYDLINLAISPNSGKFVKKSTSKFCVLDPFETNFNVTQKYNSDAWINCCKTAEEVTEKWFSNGGKANILDIFRLEKPNFSVLQRKWSQEFRENLAVKNNTRVDEPWSIPTRYYLEHALPQLTFKNCSALHESKSTLRRYCLENGLPGPLYQNDRKKNEFTAKVGLVMCLEYGISDKAKVKVITDLLTKLKAMGEEEKDIIRQNPHFYGDSDPIWALKMYCINNGLPEPDFKQVRNIHSNRFKWKVIATVNTVVSSEIIGKLQKARKNAAKDLLNKLSKITIKDEK